MQKWQFSATKLEPKCVIHNIIVVVNGENLHKIKADYPFLYCPKNSIIIPKPTNFKYGQKFLSPGEK